MIQDKLELRGICKSFGGIKALEDINLELHSGMVYGLAGENGAGKSTTMKIINGAYVADEGEILVDGVVTKITSPLDAQKIGVGMVYQELNMLPDLNIAEKHFYFAPFREKNWIYKLEKNSRKGKRASADDGNRY